MAMKEVGLIARLITTKLSKDVKKHQQEMRKASEATKKAAKEMRDAGKEMAKAFKSAQPPSKELGETLKRLAQQSKATTNAEIGALKKSTQETRAASATKISSLQALISNIRTTMLVAGALAATFGALAGVIIGMAKKFNEAAQDVRLFHLTMGGTVQQASEYIQQAKGAGVATKTLQVAVGQLSKRLVDYQLRIASGTEHTTEFQRAIDALGIDLKDANGNLRSTSDLLPEIADRLSEIGPGAVTSGIAMNLLGRSGREMLPFLLQGSEEMERMTKRAEELGAVMTYKDVAAAEDFRKATDDLDKLIQPTRYGKNGSSCGLVLLPTLSMLRPRETRRQQTRSLMRLSAT